MADALGHPVEGTTTNRVYVILGTSHAIQWRPKDACPYEVNLIDGLESAIRCLVTKYRVMLIAEEAPHDVLTVAREIANGERICYLQIDMLPHEVRAFGILQEVERGEPPTAGEPPNTEYRFCHADDVRENFWLDRIESTKTSPALIVCGYAHRSFLAKKATDRGCIVAEEAVFPLDLAGRQVKCLP